MEQETQETQYGPVFRPSWEILCRDAVLVGLEIGFWRAGNKLDAGNLGLGASQEFGEFASRWVSLGQKKLCPPERIKALSSISVRARQIMSEYGIKTPWGMMVRKEVYLDLRAKLQELADSHNALIDALCSEYSAWVAEVRDAYAGQAVTASRAAGAFGAAIDVDQYVESVVALIPAPEQIRAKSRFRWWPQDVRAPQVLAQGLDVAELEQRAETLRAQIETLQTEEQQAIAKAELEAVQRRIEIEATIHAEMVAAAEEMRRKQIDDVIEEAAARTRTLLVEAVEQARAAMKKRDEDGAVSATVHGKTLASLRQTLDQVQAITFSADADTDAMLAELRAWCDQAPETRTKASLNTVLSDVEAVVKADLITLGRPVRGPKGTLETPEIETVRAARQRLGLKITGDDEEGSAAIGARKERTL